MTYKYYDVREEIINNCSEKELKKPRTWKEMKKLMKWYFWIFLSIMFVSVFTMFVIFFSDINMLWCLIPIVPLLVGALIFEYKYESLCNRDIRRKEKEKHKAAYNEYIENIKKC